MAVNDDDKASFIEAKKLVALGFSVIPIDHPTVSQQSDPRRIGKIPLVKWQAFQKRGPTDKELREWFGKGQPRNIGIVTGAVSGLVVVDTDSAQAEAWAQRNLPATPMSTKTAKGLHRYYRHPGPRALIRNKARLRTHDGRIALDIRADGGYVVAPGSLHYTGVLYERVGEWPSLDKLPFFDTAWLESESLENARRYVAAVPPAVEGQGGDSHTFSLACRLIRGFDLTDDEALSLMRDWNARSVPPWREDELVKKVESARKYGEEPYGARAVRHGTKKVEMDSRPGIKSVKGRTEAANAKRLVAQYSSDFRWVRAWEKYAVWDGRRWGLDPTKLEAFAKSTADELWFALSTLLKEGNLNDRDIARLIAFVKASNSANGIRNALFLARSEPHIPIRHTIFDTRPMLFNCANGTLDLETGRLRPHGRNDLLTKISGVVFDPTAPCPAWQRFLKEVFKDDLELSAFMQRAAGYSLTASIREQCLFFLYGSGSNGKTTFVTTLRRFGASMRPPLLATC